MHKMSCENGIVSGTELMRKQTEKWQKLQMVFFSNVLFEYHGNWQVRNAHERINMFELRNAYA